MDIEKRLMEHYKRWNIEYDYETQFQNFKLRIFEDIKIFLEELRKINVNNYKKLENFVYKLIKEYDPRYYQCSKNYSDPDANFGQDRTKYIICTNYIVNARNLGELATALQYFFWAIEENYEDEEVKELIEKFITEIKKKSSLTPNVSFNIHQVGKQVILYPIGDELLDENIINYVLSGLENYPNSGKHFIQALEIYQNGDTSLYLLVLDELRCSIEQLLKTISEKEKKSLEKQQKFLLPWLEKKKISLEIITMYNTLLFGQYTEYMNERAKHNDKYSINDVEFMIYLTGNFMRLLIQCDNQ